MIFTLITDENASYFKGAIGEAYKEDRADRLFCGVIDEEDDAAAGAAYFDAAGEELTLGYIGVAEEKRRRGFGKCMIKESAKLAKKHGFSRITASFYGDAKEAKENELLLFLKACGFKLRKAPIERQVYLFSDVYAHATELLGEKKEGISIKTVQELDTTEREKLLSLYMEGEVPYFDEDILFSGENRFGGVAFRGDEPVAAAAILPFEDGVRIDQIYGRREHISELHALLWDSLEKVKKASKRKHLYIDVGGEQLLKLQKKRFEKAGVNCEQCLQGYIAEKETWKS